MNFFADIMTDKKGIRDIYEIYLTRINGIYFDELSSLQIIYIIKGKIKIYLEKEYKILNEGDFLILNQFENKFLYADEDNLILITKISSEYLKNLGDEFYISRFRHLESCDDELAHNILNLYNTSKSIGNEELNMSLVHRIIKLLCRKYISKDKSISNISEKSHYIKKVEEYIIKDESSSVNLNYISKQLHVSNSYLSKTFSEMSGINFSEYIQQHRLYYATTYLLNTKMTVEEIAISVGLESIKSLNRIFGRYLNITPSAFRKKYSSETNENFEQCSEFLDIFNRFKVVNYGEYVRKNCSRNIERFEIDINNKRKYNTFENWKIIKNLKSLGKDYIETLESILKQFNIREIILRLKYANNKFYLSDLNREFHYFELKKILNICIEYDVNIVVSLVFPDLTEYKEEDLEIKKKVCSGFLESILNKAGIENMRKFTYLIDISKVTEYIDSKEKLDMYIKSIYHQEELLRNITECDNYNWGFEVGVMTVERLDEMNKVAEVFKGREFKNKPKVLSMTYKDNYISGITDIRDLNKIRNRLHENRKKLTELVGKFSFEISKVYINDLFYNIDISEVNYLYSDLLIVSILMESLYEADKDVNYITEYKVRDRNEADGVYYPVYKDKSGFFTPLYWISLLLDSIMGRLIYKEPGCFVTKDNENIYILLYGDIVTDYSFAKKKGLENLENEYRTVEIKIKGLKGKYKIITERLSFENGTSGYYLRHFNEYKYLTESEKEYIKRVAIPKLYISLKNINSDFNNSVRMEPFEVVLQKYIRI